MRRWNGWGDDAIDYPLRQAAIRFLEQRVGTGGAPCDVTFDEAIAGVPPSRLADHPLVSVDPGDRLAHARGQSLPDWVALRGGRIDAFPDGVAWPTSSEQVRALLNYAARTGTAVIPYGGGTSVVGHINPPVGDRPVLTVDLARLNRMVAFDADSGLASFGAGIAGPELEAHLRERGFTLGHFPQSFEYSTLGGWVVTRSTGQQSLGYGRMERLFAGGVLEAPAGTVIMPPFPASAAGPDLRELVLGSEGRLGILTEATVRITPLPEAEAFHAVFLPDWAGAQSAARAIVQARLPLCMLRASTPAETETTLALAGRERLIDLLEHLLALRKVAHDKCMLLLGFVGRERVVEAARKEALGIARACGGIHVGTAFGKEWHRNRFRTPYLRNALWEHGYAIDTLETAIRWDGVADMVDGIEAALREALAGIGEDTHVFTHLSHLYPHGSSIYATYLFRVAPTPEGTLARWQRMKHAASQAITTRGGTISHQHGIGVDHAPYLAKEKGSLGMAALRTACAIFDPPGMMNPGKLL